MLATIIFVLALLTTVLVIVARAKGIPQQNKGNAQAEVFFIILACVLWGLFYYLKSK